MDLVEQKSFLKVVACLTLLGHVTHYCEYYSTQKPLVQYQRLDMI